MSPAAVIRGVVPILPTPFTAGGDVDFAALPRLVDFAITAGAAAVGTPAFGSEFYKLDGSERTRIIETVIGHAAGRIPVIIQCNHPSPRVAAQLAAEAERAGASVVNTALPRAFAASPGSLLDYARAVCDRVSLPVVVQDWNPSGVSVGVDFATALRSACPNFSYLKLEEPGIGPLIREIISATGGKVGVFSGWGGLHLLELAPAGIGGIMPGLALTDVLVRVWHDLEQGSWVEAYRRFAGVSPFIEFSLQTFEQFHHAEKRLLVVRGILASAAVRPVTVELNADASHYLDRLIACLVPDFPPSAQRL